MSAIAAGFGIGSVLLVDVRPLDADFLDVVSRQLAEEAAVTDLGRLGVLLRKSMRIRSRA